MNATIVAVDLAKSIFEIAAADADWRIAQRSRLPRSKFFGFFMQLEPCQVVMEACGSAHYWARRISALGHTVRLLPAHYVKAYVRRNKTDRADAAALLEAARCADIREVPVKTVDAQQIQSLHRLRSQWMSTRQRYVNTLRGILREFGFAIPLGVNVAKDRIGTALADPESEVPPALRATLAEMLQEIRLLEQKILGIEHQLNALTRHDVRVQQLRQIPGIGALTSTALRAIVGDSHRRGYSAISFWPSLRVLVGTYAQRALECREAPARKNLQARRCLLANPHRTRCSICAARCASCRALGTPTRSFTPVGSRLRAPTRSQQGHCRAR